MKQRSALTIVFSLLLALLIAGCSQVTIQVPAPAATEPVEGEAMTGAAAPVEIEVWHQFTEGVGTQALLTNFTAEYEASHPEVRINWNWAGFEQYDQRLRARVESNDPPDAVWNSSQLLTIYAREGWLQRVDEALAGKNYEGDATWSDIFFPNLIEQAYVEDGSEGGAII
jgi:ABC-type glycerol-3-phosphate transport system substrate-binding protein